MNNLHEHIDIRPYKEIIPKHFFKCKDLFYVIKRYSPHLKIYFFDIGILKKFNISPHIRCLKKRLSNNSSMCIEKNIRI